MKLGTTRFTLLWVCFLVSGVSVFGQPTPTPTLPPAPTPPPDPPMHVDESLPDDNDIPVQPVQEVGTSTSRTYSTSVGEDPKEIHGSDGLVGPLEKLAKQMAQANEGKGRATAELDLAITPKLNRGKKPTDPATVTLIFQETAWNVSGNMPDDKKGQLEGERAYALEKLSAWKMNLSREQMAALDAGQTIDFPIKPPFALLALLKGPDVSVNLSQGPRPKIIRLLVRPAGNGSGVVMGKPVVAEVAYDRPVKLPTRTVHLAAGGAPLTLPAKNSGDDTVFVTDPFLLLPEDTADNSTPTTQTRDAPGR